MSRFQDSPPLPIGKLPGSLLGRLLGELSIADPAVIVGPGIGRDAAAIDLGDVTLVVKTDPITFATESAAHYLVNVNANDLACLGATPRWLMVTALLPAHTTEAMVERQFRELDDACRSRGVSLIGGHTEVTSGVDRPILVGHLLGTVPSDRLLRPGGAKSGDLLLLTKALAIEGTALIARERRDEVIRRHGAELAEKAAHLLVDPGISVVFDANTLLTAGGVTALHDPTEGGLAMGVRELAVASGCGARLERETIPILPETAALAAAFDLDPLGLLASGSLLAAIDPTSLDKVLDACQAVCLPAAIIGQLTRPSEGFRLSQPDGEIDLPLFASDEVSRVLADGST